MGRTKAATSTGIAAGIAFFAHSMAQNSHAWPLLWTFLAGAAAIVLSSRREAHNAGAAIGSGALAGLIAGVVFVIATSISVFVLGIPQQAARQLDGSEAAVFTGLVTAAALGVVAAAIGAALAHLLFARKAKR